MERGVKRVTAYSAIVCWNVIVFYFKKIATITLTTAAIDSILYIIFLEI